MKRDINRFDERLLERQCVLYSTHDKKVPGFMKDENNSAIMIEFIELRVKMYALRIEDVMKKMYRRCLYQRLS